MRAKERKWIMSKEADDKRTAEILSEAVRVALMVGNMAYMRRMRS